MKKLSEYAKEHNIHYRTAFNHFHKGLIEGAYQLPTGTIVIPDSYKAEKEERVVIYTRVSSSENKKNLDSQAERLVNFCNAKGWIVSEVVKEIGSGLNDNRKKLSKVLKDSSVTKIVVEHKDRFSRFGMSYIQQLLNDRGTEIVIVNPADSSRDDLMQDFVSIITSFTARLYGLRRNKRRTEKLIENLKDETK